MIQCSSARHHITVRAPRPPPVQDVCADRRGRGGERFDFADESAARLPCPKRFFFYPPWRPVGLVVG